MKTIRTGTVGLLVAAQLVVSANAAEVDPELEQAVRNAAAQVLNDPYSAVFTFDVMTELGGGRGGKICGTVNAKNGLGDYTGKQFFYAGYLHLGDEYQVIAFDVPGYSLEQAVAHGGICD